MTDTVQLQIVTAVIAFLGTVFSGIMAYMIARLNQQQAIRADDAAVKVAELKLALEKANEEQAENARAAAAKVEKVKRDLDESARLAARVSEEQREQIDAAAAKVDDVKRDLRNTADAGNHKLDSLARVAVATHLLVNSNMANQLKINMTVTRRLADLTRDPADIRAAQVAREAYEEHQRRQAEADKHDRGHTSILGG